MKSIVIDVHAHFTPKLMSERFEVNAAKFPDVKLVKSDKGVTLQFPGTAPTRPIMPGLSDLAGRQAWMDKAGIDHQVVGGWLDSFGYELPAAQGAAWSRYLNDCMWEQFRDERRFSALATVPLQDGKLAAEVLAEAMERGFAGVMVGTLNATGDVTSWARVGGNSGTAGALPITTVFDLSVGPDGFLYAATHGRGIWRTPVSTL